MNKKGFTLIELLAVIVLIGMIGIITVPNLLDTYNSSKEASYQMLLKNIITASQNYYTECEYGDLKNTTKYGSYACQIDNNEIITTLRILANTGFLTVKDVDPNDKTKKVVLDPRSNNDMSDCKIKITKIITNNDDNLKVTYQVESNSTNNICPNSYKGD